MYKGKMPRIIVLCMVIVLVMGFMMGPQIILADSPQGSKVVVYPTQTPPSEPPKAPPSKPSEIRPDKVQEAVYEGDAGTRTPSWMFYAAIDPYKSGTSAIGLAYTETNYIPFVFKVVYATSWLWRWDDCCQQDWVLMAEDDQHTYCPPWTDVFAMATKTNANSGWWVVTSSHRVWADNQPLHYATDESDLVWLVFD